jgi:hypothetical protein
MTLPPLNLLFVSTLWVAPAALLLAAYVWERARRRRTTDREMMPTWTEPVQAPARPTTVDAKREPQHTHSAAPPRQGRPPAASSRYGDVVQSVRYAAANVQVASDDGPTTRRCTVCLN